jgi:toxin ParE1/3/4
MKVVFLRSSEPDLRWLNRYYRRVFPAGGRNARRELAEALQRLSDHPKIGPATGDGDTRRLVVPHTPFSLLYRIGYDRLEILRVLDARANPAQSENES